MNARFRFSGQRRKMPRPKIFGLGKNDILPIDWTLGRIFFPWLILSSAGLRLWQTSSRWTFYRVLGHTCQRLTPLAVVPEKMIER